jgi:hypothetical protein
VAQSTPPVMFLQSSTCDGCSTKAVPQDGRQSIRTRYSLSCTESVPFGAKCPPCRTRQQQQPFSMLPSYHARQVWTTCSLVGLVKHKVRNQLLGPSPRRGGDLAGERRGSKRRGRGSGEDCDGPADRPRKRSVFQHGAVEGLGEPVENGVMASTVSSEAG